MNFWSSALFSYEETFEMHNFLKSYLVFQLIFVIYTPERIIKWICLKNLKSTTIHVKDGGHKCLENNTNPIDALKTVRFLRQFYKFLS